MKLKISNAHENIQELADRYGDVTSSRNMDDLFKYYKKKQWFQFYKLLVWLEFNTPKPNQGKAKIYGTDGHYMMDYTDKEYEIIEVEIWEMGLDNFARLLVGKNFVDNNIVNESEQTSIIDESKLDLNNKFVVEAYKCFKNPRRVKIINNSVKEENDDYDLIEGIDIFIWIEYNTETKLYGLVNESDIVNTHDSYSSLEEFINESGYYASDYEDEDEDEDY